MPAALRQEPLHLVPRERLGSVPREARGAHQPGHILFDVAVAKRNLQRTTQDDVVVATVRVLSLASSFVCM